MKAWKAELFLFFITFVWGGTFIFTKIGLDDTTPGLYVVIRFSIALLIALLLFGKHLLKINRKILIQGLVLGLFLAVDLYCKPKG